jgi:hypothetical protein
MEVSNLIPFFVSLKTRNTKQFFCFEKLISNTTHFFTMIIIIIVYFSLQMNAILNVSWKNVFEAEAIK